MIRLSTEQIDDLRMLSVGRTVLLSGTVYTARDAAHKRIFSLIDEGKVLPFDIKNAFIYFAGPTPAKPGLAVGSCGPTTSSRMDVYTPKLMDMGLFCTIGKGERSPQVVEACKRNKGIYLCAPGGAGALASKAIKSSGVIAFEDLGCESIKKFYIENFSLTVAIDTLGNSIFCTHGG